VIFLLFDISSAVFCFIDFTNETDKLFLNGDASWNDYCVDSSASPSQPLNHQGTVGSLAAKYITSDIGDDDWEQSLFYVNKTIDLASAQFGHRDTYNVIENGDYCNTRLRLTSSHISQVGSAWYKEPLAVLDGFETSFTFQILDQSQSCTYHVDPNVALKKHKSCYVHGGDGFAFVLHHHSGANETALGKSGQQLGYGGIPNSLAIEFDTWFNVPDQNSDDVIYDHISIHSAGGLKENDSGYSTALGHWRNVSLADGKMHQVKIKYLPHVEHTYLEFMSANEYLIPYLKKDGNGRGIGTLAIFLDDGIVSEKPILAVPLTLSVLLDLPSGQAYAGFTASTGLKWQKHDILNWTWSNVE